jgi:hypothetical protein
MAKPSTEQEHHQQKSFNQEYAELSKRFDLERDRRYILQAGGPIRFRSY